MSKTNVNFQEFMRLANEPCVPKTRKAMVGNWGDPVTPKQKYAMHKLGIGYSSMLWKGQAIIVLNVAIDRCNKKLATAKQMRYMAIKGITEVHKRTYKEATFILQGGNPDNYKGFVYTFKYDDKEINAYSRKEADQKYKELKALGKPIQVKRIEL